MQKRLQVIVMYKSCAKCGKIHEYNYRCNAGRIYTNTDDAQLRSRYSWQKKRDQIKRDAQGLCEVCKAMNLYTYDGLEVHHIVKLRDNPEGLLDDYNLICLCTYHHKQADANEIEVDYLKELARKRIEDE